VTDEDLGRTKQHPTLGTVTLAEMLHTWAAHVHALRWHWHRARDSLSSAVSLAPTDERRRALAAAEEAIRRAQGERDMAQAYRASRNTGPAAALRGRVVVAYVLVDPAGPRRWTDVDRVFARSTLARVERWYVAKAAARGVVAPEFVDRVFEVPLAGGDLPVFPDVASTIVPPGFKVPAFSANSIMEMPMRSLTEKPGFKFSIFASTVALTPLVSRESLTSGVCPIKPRTFS